jgi:hypothetical protein
MMLVVGNTPVYSFGFGDVVMELTYIISPAYKELYGPIEVVKSPRSDTSIKSNEIEYCVDNKCVTVLRVETIKEEREIIE